MFGFSKMVQLVIHLMSRSTYCAKRSKTIWCVEMVMSIGHQETGIEYSRTISCGALLYNKCYVNHPVTIDHLKTSIRNVIDEILLLF